MEINVEYLDTRVADINLVPEENEDADTLYQYSRLLSVKNPAVAFSRRAQAGEFKALNDEEYYRILDRIKAFCAKFYGKELDRNIFQLTSDMIKFIMQYDKELINCVDAPDIDPVHSREDDVYSVDDIIDLYNLDYKDRTDIYDLIIRSRESVFGEGFKHVSVYDTGRAFYYVPDERFTKCINMGDKLVVLTFYDASGTNTCIDYGTIDDVPDEVMYETEKYLANHFAIQHDRENPDEVLDALTIGKLPVYWYSFVQEKDYDYFLFEGVLKINKTYDYSRDGKMRVHDMSFLEERNLENE